MQAVSFSSTGLQFTGLVVWHTSVVWGLVEWGWSISPLQAFFLEDFLGNYCRAKGENRQNGSEWKLIAFFSWYGQLIHIYFLLIFFYSQNGSYIIITLWFEMCVFVFDCRVLCHVDLAFTKSLYELILNAVHRHRTCSAYGVTFPVPKHVFTFCSLSYCSPSRSRRYIFYGVRVTLS